jgi:prevent-host-death family protein
VSFRNRRGEDLDVPSFKATDAKNAFGRMLETALRKGAIVITKHEDPKAVLLSWEEFEALTSARSGQLAALTTEFDAALERMQTARSRKGMRDAFEATPAQLGRRLPRAAAWLNLADCLHIRSRWHKRGGESSIAGAAFNERGTSTNPIRRKAHP